MGTLQGKHYGVLCAFLMALAVQIGGLADLHDALTPTFISGVLMQLASVIGALYVDAPVSSTNPGSIKDPSRL